MYVFISSLILYLDSELMVVVVGVGSVGQDLRWLVKRLTLVVGVEVVQEVVGLLWVVLRG